MNERFDLEAAGWQLIAYLDPWIWHIKQGCGLAALILLFLLPWNVPKWMLAFRFVAIIGAAMIFFSWGNTSFGPLGDLVFWPGFVGYLVSVVYTIWPAIRAGMAAAPPAPEKVIINYLTSGRVPPSKG